MIPEPQALMPGDATETGNRPLLHAERVSIITTASLTVVLVILAVISFSFFEQQHGWILCLATSLGALGGLMHEFAQSGGKILFFERKQDGFYLGALAGAMLGALAGLLAIRGYLMDAKLPVSLTEVSYDTFIAGLGLKGVIEAASGQAVPLNRPSNIRDIKLPAPPATAPND